MGQALGKELKTEQEPSFRGRWFLTSHAELATYCSHNIPFLRAPQILGTIPASASRCRALACEGEETNINFRIPCN